MKKLGYFLSLVIILSVSASVVVQKPAGDLSVSASRLAQKPAGDLSASASGVAQKPADNTVASNFQPSSPSVLTTDSSAIPPSEVADSKAGEALTPFQLQLQEAINQRKAAGLPVPASMTFEYQATSVDAMQQIVGTATTPTGPVKIVSTTIIVFDNPQQAGYDEWPALVVKDNLPPEAHGTVKEGDYTEAYRQFIAQEVPGIWEQYEFGQEPRTHTIEETIEIMFPQRNLLAADSTIGAQAVSTDDILMGFTYMGPHINYTFSDSAEGCVLGICATLYEYEAGFKLDWALGLRLPAQANLTGPNQLVQGSPFSFSSALTPRDWSASNYALGGVAPENGNEFVLRLKFFVGARAWLPLVGDICSGCFVKVDKDFSESFPTPFGTDAFFPIDPINIPIYTLDLSAFSFGAGFKLDPNLGSDKITADWQASGDASGSGQITYSQPGSPVSFGPVNACNLGPTNQAQIQLTNFEYFFNQFFIQLLGTVNFNLFGFIDFTKDQPIYTFNLSPIFGGLGLHVGAHTQCTFDFNCTPTGPDNRINLSLPVVDLTPPTTSLTPSGTAGNNGWYVSDVQASLSATDLPAGCGIGVKQTEYSFDGTNWNVYTGPFMISNEGITTVHYRSIDNEGNVEPTKTQTFKIDKTPPTITGAPTTAPNAYGWYNTDVVVHFDASDAVSGIDTVTPDQILSGEGASQSVTGTVVDMAGFSASFTVTGINIDKTSPDISITSPETRVYENTETFNIIWSATDSLSGIASESGTMNGTAVANSQLIELLAFGPGPHTVTVEAIDQADNTTSVSVVFSVSVDSKGLLAALEYMCNLGWIDKHGICNSLAAKLSAAIESIDRGNLNAAENQLNAFINELDAQKDKSINQSAYDVLHAGALYVIDHLADEQ